jgi:glycosyltransferase involved in cell wall biosynthesis
MKIGFISRAFPVEPEKSVHGMYKRMGMFIDGLKGLGKLDMLFYVEPELPVSESFTREMENRLAQHWEARLQLDLCNLAPVKASEGPWQHYISPALSIHDHPPYSRMTQKEQIDAVRSLLSRNPDVVFVHKLSCMLPILLTEERHPKIYFDLDDIEHVAFARSVKQPPWWLGKSLYYLRLPVLRAWERRAIRYSRATFVCSEHDRDYLSGTYGSKNVTVIPNAVDLCDKLEMPANPTLLFLGSFSYPPNVVAADYLIRKIWPTILAALPEAKLLIAGAHPESIQSYKENPPGVEFLGFVKDLAGLYRKVMVVSCPMLAGGGTRIKILEAAGHGKPVVSTTIGAEGIELRKEYEILLRDDPSTFSDACIMLLRDRNLSVRIGQAARFAVARLYDKSMIVKRIRESIVSGYPENEPS